MRRSRPWIDKPHDRIFTSLMWRRAESEMGEPIRKYRLRIGVVIVLSMTSCGSGVAGSVRREADGKSPSGLNGEKALIPPRD